MKRILEKAAKYKRVSTVLYEGEAHLNDPYTPPPKILTPPPPRMQKSPDDITDFPAEKTVPIPESIPYRVRNFSPSHAVGRQLPACLHPSGRGVLPLQRLSGAREDLPLVLMRDFAGTPLSLCLVETLTPAA